MLITPGRSWTLPREGVYNGLYEKSILGISKTNDHNINTVGVRPGASR